MKKQYLVILVLFLAGLTACNMNVSQPNDRLRVIFETDIGNDIDDALALDMIYKYIEENKMDLLAIMSNKNSKFSAEFIDIMSTWYGHSNIPIGIVKEGVDSENYARNYARSVCELTINEKPAFERTLSDFESLPEASSLYRKLLTQEDDHSVTIISVGFSTNLAKLLDSDADEYSSLTGRELVARKVKLLSMMAGSFGENSIAEYNVIKDVPSSQKVFKEWPTPIVVSPFEVGIQINYPGSSIENDFNWGILHPMVEAYKAYRKMPYDRPTWDLTSLLYVIHPDSSYMSLSPNGFITTDEKGFTTFKQDEKGTHTYLSVNSDQAETVKEYFVKLITQKPKRIQSLCEELKD